MSSERLVQFSRKKAFMTALTSSTPRVHSVPEKVLKTGFEFFYEGVEDSLRFQLGRAE